MSPKDSNLPFVELLVTKLCNFQETTYLLNQSPDLPFALTRGMLTTKQTLASLSLTL